MCPLTVLIVLPCPLCAAHTDRRPSGARRSVCAVSCLGVGVALGFILHLRNLHFVRVVNGSGADLWAVPPLPGRRRLAAIAYLKKRRGASWSDSRERGLPRRRPLRSGSSHAMLMARWEGAFWEVEFGGDG